MRDVGDAAAAVIALLSLLVTYRFKTRIENMIPQALAFKRDRVGLPWHRRSAVQCVTRTGRCVALVDTADHLQYTSSGVIATLDNQPNCPSGCDNEHWAAGHMSSVDSYCYGTYTVSLHTAKRDGSNGDKAFSCFGMYSDVSV